MNQPPEITTAGSSPQRITAEDPAAKGAGILERYSGLPSFSALDGDESSGQNEKWSLETSQLGDSKPRVGTSGDMLLAELIGWDDLEMEDVQAAGLDEDSSMDMDICLESVLDQQLALEGDLCSVETTGASEPVSFWHVMAGDSRSAKEDQAPYDDQMDLEADDGMPEAEAVGWKHVQDDRVTLWQQGIKAPIDANAGPSEWDS